MKKISAILLALILVLSMSSVAMAADNGKITVTNATVGQTYTIYRIFDLQSYSGSNYAYTVNAAWSTFVNQDTIKGVYVNIDNNGGVTWVTNADAQEFAKLALAYAKDNSIAHVATEVATGSTVEFTGLDLGYYLVDSSLGALCALNTTDTEAEVADKNTKPTLEKKVKEGNVYGDTATASMGDTVDFKLTVNVGSSRYGTGIDAVYVITDTLPAGMTYVDGSAKIGDSADNLTVTYVNDVLTITVAQAYLETLSSGATFDITYSATLDTDAVVGGNGNKNTATLTYNNFTTTEADAIVYTYAFDVVKTDNNKNVLTGAEFKLYSDAGCTNEIGLVYDNTLAAYRKAGANETPTAIQAGKVTITGLDAGKYYLKETAAPTGYNPVVTAIEVDLSGNNYATMDEADATKYVSGGIQVINLTGSELPSTGGMGTTIFYVVGGLLMAAAVVLLVSKKKVSAR